MNFNSSQKEAVTHHAGPALVLAGPGSGKTAVVTERVYTLINDYNINPSNILVITFTKAAASEMKERFLKRNASNSTYVVFGTFHSIFFMILRHAYNYQASDIIKEEEQYDIIKKIIFQMKIECEDEKELASNLLAEISHVKGGLIELKHYYPTCCGQEMFFKIYNYYEDALRRNHKIDFDDMLVFCYELFSERKDILAAWQNKFRYILIDEFQDINAAQYSVVKMLAAPQNNLFVVGDDDQSIYGFRGSNPEIMLNFEKDYPDCKKVVLNVNYRSQAGIVRAAQNVIKYNKKRFEKEIMAFKSQVQPPQILEFPDISYENNAVIDIIRKLSSMGDAYSDIAILTRLNSGAGLIAEKLYEYNIPFCTRDRIPGIYEHWIAKNIFTYIKIAMGNRERKEFISIINRPKRYISRDVFDMPTVSFEELKSNYFDKPWMQERIERFEDDIDMISGLNPYGAVNYIRRAIGYNDFLDEYAREKGIKADELHDIINELQESAREFNTFEEWFNHIEEYKKTLNEQYQKTDTQQDAVQIMTMHGSKGLEYKNVIILDANEGVAPYKKAVLDSEIEEERRMFYVAMTRAKEKLIICHTKTRYNKPSAVSRFVTEIDG